MTSTRPALAAERRTVTGKAVAGLRRDGRLPAVVFGHGVESAPVTLDAHDFTLLRRRVGPNALIDLSIDGSKPTPVLVHGVQIHKVNRQPIHVDLFAVRMTEELTVEVSLIGTGTAPAAESGGTLVHPVSSVKVRALPGNLPESIHYDLAALDNYDATITVADLVAPEGVTIQADPADVIARVLAPRVEEEVAPAAEAAAAEAETTAEAEGGAAAEPAAEG